MKVTTAGIALTLAGIATVSGCGGDDAPTAGAGSSAATTTATATGAAADGQAIGSPTDWLTTVCPEGEFSTMEVFTEGRGGPSARNEGYYCTAVPQDGAVAYHSIELFTYDADPSDYWAAQAADPGSFVYYAVGRTSAGWAVLLEDDSRLQIADPLIAAAAEVGFTTFLGG